MMMFRADQFSLVSRRVPGGVGGGGKCGAISAFRLFCRRQIFAPSYAGLEMKDGDVCGCLVFEEMMV